MKINTMGRGSKVFSQKRLSLIAGAAFLVVAPFVHAGDFQKFYQIDTDFSYQTNPGFQKGSAKSDVFALKVSPSAQFKYADELNEYNLDLGFSVYENTNEDALVDYVAPEIIADWSRELQFGKVGVVAEYNHIASRAETLRLGVNNGAIQDVENITKTGKVKGIFDVDFNAKWSLNNYAEYTNVKYSEDVSDLADYNVIGAESKLIYKNTDQFSTYAAIDYFDLDPRRGVIDVNVPDPDNPGQTIVDRQGQQRKDSDVYSLVVGGIYTPAENIKVDFSIGAYNASGEFDDSGVKVGLNGYYYRDRYTVYWDAYRKMVAGGNGVFQLNEFFIVGGTYQLSEVRNLRASYIRNENKPDSEISNFDVVYDNLSFAYEQEYEDWKGSVYVQFVGLDLDGDQRRSEVIGLTISYDPYDFKEFRRDPLNF